jgi:hypothetical protein
MAQRQFSSAARFGLGAVAAAAALVTLPAQAASIGIFGNNNIAAFYGSLPGHTVSVLSDAQISTAGFLDSFDVFVYTRDGYSFGTSLSAAAAANVKAYVNGNVALLNGDFQDDIGTPATNALFTNILDYVASNPNGGYIGEYTGSFAAFTSNGSGLIPIGLIDGASGPSGFNQGGSDGEVQITAAGLASSILTGVPFPYNPGAVEYGASASGVNPATVLAIFDNGNPAIVVGGLREINDDGKVPEPATYALVLTALAGLGFASRRKA